MYLNFLPGVGGGLGLHLFYLFKEGGGMFLIFFWSNKYIFCLFVFVGVGSQVSKFFSSFFSILELIM